MAKNYNTKTASLKATIADVRVLDAKKMNLDGKNILDYISDSEFDSYDSRDPQLKNDELDIWNTEISLSDNGHIEVKPLEHDTTTLTEEQFSTIRSCSKVINNEVLDADDNHLMYWQTDGLTNSYGKIKIEIVSGMTTNANGSIFYVTAMGVNFTSDIQIFNSDLSSLTNGTYMFYNCDELISFNSDLSSLTHGDSMFGGCSKLIAFTSNLSSLNSGQNMFQGCKLDAQSLANIVHTLPTHITNGTIHIGIGCDNTAADKLLFAQECDCDTWQELLDDFTAKNWTVAFQCNGRPTTTYNLRRGETLPVYTKLEEVTESEHYTYTSQDGSKFYNINYFHSTNGSTEGYDVFSSLEEAISTYNVTPKN